MRLSHVALLLCAASSAFAQSEIGSPVFNGGSPATLIVGVPVTFSITASGIQCADADNGASWPGGNLSNMYYSPCSTPATAHGTWTPAVAGSQPLQVAWSYYDGTTSWFVITSSPALTVINPAGVGTTALPTAYVGTAYSGTLTPSGGLAPLTWSKTAGTLPPGLSFNSNGTLTGTPTNNGTYNFTVKVVDSSVPSSTSGSGNISITVSTPVSVITGTLPNGLISSAYSQSLSATGGTAPYAWTVTSGQLPTGLSLSSSGAITGTPTAGGTYSFTVKAADSGSGTATQTLSIFIVSLLNISTASLPNGIAGSVYSTTLAATGGITPYTWSLAAGSLPTGLSLSAGGVISGTPTASGTSSFTVKAIDSTTPSAQTATQTLSITTGAGLSITTASLSNALAGSPYSASLAASGGTSPYTWSLASGSLPPGLSLAANGTISGSPTTAGTYNFTANVTDSTTPTAQSTTKALSITVTPSLTISTSTLHAGLVNSAYSASVSAAGGTSPYTWTIASGSLPAGLSLASNGSISGTPTTAGTFTFSAQVADATAPAAQTAAASLSITIGAGLSIGTTSLPSAVVNSTYSVTLAASGGTSPYTWTITSGSLPTGLTLSSNGFLSGTPTTAGSYSFTAQATDSTTPTTQSATQAYSLTVGNALGIATATLPNALATSAYSTTLTAAGGTAPYSWTISAGALPTGLSLAANGTLSGTPAAAGTYTFTVQVTDSAAPSPQTATKAFALTVSGSVAVVTASVPNGLATSAYSTTLSATGGTSPYTWSLASGSLPSGLTLASTGIISGIPTTVGTFTLTAQVSDATTPTAQTATRTFSITIGPAVSITTTAFSAGIANSAYSTTLSAAGGTAPYTWTLISGTLPSGLNLATNGIISGVPGASGSFTFTVQVTDSTSPTAQTATHALTLSISASLTITTSTLPAPLSGSPYSASLSASGGTAPYTWTLVSGTLPTGLSLSSSGAITGSAGSAGTYTFTVQATDSGSPSVQTAQRAFALTVTSPLSITSSSLPTALAGSAYSTSLAANGGSTPYTWSLLSGALPSGLTLSSSGVITGTPSANGTYAFTAQVADTTSQTVSKSLAITVAPGLSITTVSLANALAGSNYSTNLAAGGGAGPYTWAITSGSLPNGVTLTPSGVLSGTPTAAGTFTFTAQVTDSTSPTPQTATSTLSLTVGAALTVTTTSPLQSGMVGSPYSVTLAASGGTAPYIWSLAAGALPAGLSLSSSGIISGTPTSTASTAISLQVTDSTSPTPQTTIKAVSITINAALSISSTSLPNGFPSTAYSTTLTAAGGTAPYTWAITSGSLPAGLTLASTGAISGTPTTAGTSTVTIQVTDTTTPTPQAASKSLSVTIGTSVAITTTTLPNPVIGTPYNAGLAAGGGTPPYQWSLQSGSLPPGLSLSAGGYITGTPTGAGSYTFTVQTLDSSSPTRQSATAVLTISSVAALSITTASTPNATQNVAYSLILSGTGGNQPYTWSLYSGTLPAGITLTSDGILSGSPTSPGSYTFTLQLTDSSSNITTRTFSITVTGALTITTTSLSTTLVGKYYSQSLSESGGTGPFNWSLTSGSLPAGVTLSSAGILAGTPTAAGNFTLTVQLSDSTTPTPLTSTRTLTLTVASAFSITSTSLPAAPLSQPYTQALTATGGITPYTWTIASGSLPAGLSLASNGTISGTPTTAGTFTFNVQASDSTPSSPQTVTANLSITVPASLQITTTSLPNVIVGSPYSASLAATGGTIPYTWAYISGSLPPGISLASNGALSGSTTASGSYSFIAQVTDTSSPTAQIAAKTLSLNVGTTFSIVTTALPAALTGSPYSQSMAATGGISPYTWAVTSGSLATGLSLSSNGMIAGTPTANGTFTFTIQAADSSSTPQTASKTFSITAAGQLAITTASAPPATLGVPYSVTLAATGGIAPLTWTIASGALPTGLSLSSSGTISGTPSNTGSFFVTIQVTDASTPTPQSTTRSFTILSSATFAISTSTLPNGTTNSLYSQTISAVGGASPYSFSLASGSLPSGLTLTTTGTLYGLPTAAGTYNFTVAAVDSCSPNPQNATRTFSVTITAGLAIPTSALPTGILGGSYNAALTATGGTAPYSWVALAGSLPSGLSLAANGAISGTPLNSGTFPVTIQVADSSQTQLTLSKAFTIAVTGAFNITTATLPATTINTPYTLALAATGGTAPYIWAVTSGTLPAGMALSSTGTLSGTPTTMGSYTLTIQAIDSTPPTALTASKSFTLTVAAGFTITTTSLPNALINNPYSQALSAIAGVTPYAWSIASGSLPPGLSLSSAGVLSGSPNAAGSYTFTVQAADSTVPPQTTTRAFTLVVAPPLSITTTTLTPAIRNVPYSEAILATGGITPYSWSIAAGSLPAGLALSTDGTLTGTPTASGVYTFTVQAIDATTPTAQSAAQQLTLIVKTGLGVVTATLPDASLSTPYTTTLAATGGATPYIWSLASGSLPPGLNLGSNGTITGSPSTAGTFPFAVLVTDSTSSGSQTASRTLTITVQGLLTVTTTTLPDATANAPYTASLAATGGTTPYTWAITDGSLPPGVTLNTAGVLAGTPKVAGAFAFTVQVTDANTPAHTATATIPLIVAAGLHITTPSLPPGQPNLQYTAVLTAAGGTTPYSWALLSGSLPAGLALDANGTIAGTPTASATAAFTVQVSDTAQSAASLTYSLTIGNAISITTASLTPARVNTLYSMTFAAANGNTPYSWSVASGTLPPGLVLLPTGDFLGQPSQAGSWTFTIKVTDNASTSASHTYALVVMPNFTITTTSLPDGALLSPYAAALAAANGTTPYTWTIAVGALPNGVVMDPTGLISGQPALPGDYTVVIQAVDSSYPQYTAQRQFTLHIDNGLSISTSALPPGSTGSYYFTAFSAVNGLPPYTWSAPAIPDGFVLLPTGEFFGTPTQSGQFEIDVTVTDTSSPAAQKTKSFTLTLARPLTIETATLPTATSTQPYATAVIATGGTPPYAWTVASGSLPPGLRLAPNGVITGSPTGQDPATFTLQVTDRANASQTRTYTLAPTSILTITTATLPVVAVATPMSVFLAAQGGVGGTLTWSADSLPQGITLVPNLGLLIGIPASVGPQAFKLHVTDGTQTATASLTLTVTHPVSMPPESLPSAIQNRPYIAAVHATGGATPYTWSAAGPMPSGLTLYPSGILAGTFSGLAAAYPVPVCVTDASGGQACGTRTLQVNPALTFQPATLPSVDRDAPFTYHLAAQNALGGVTFASLFALPSGLSLRSDGTLNGQMQTAGTYGLSILATDSIGQTAAAEFRLTVLPPLTVTTATLPPLVTAHPYVAPLSVMGGVGPYTWLLTSGTLPPGLALDASGFLYGTPTAISAASQLTFSVTDAANHTASITITVASTAPLSISTSALEPGHLMVPYQAQLTAANGAAPYTWALTDGTLPEGLSLDPNGVLSGTPGTTGDFQIIVEVADSQMLTATARYTLTIASALTLPSKSLSLPNATATQPYSYTLSSNYAGAASWFLQAGELPDGLSLSPDGTLSGTPTTPGTTYLLVTATYQSDSVSQALTLTVAPPADSTFQQLALPTAALPTAITRLSYSTTLTPTNGTPPYQWSLIDGSLPTGLALTPSGTIAGTPTVGGLYTFTLTAVDAAGLTGTAAYTIPVGQGLTTLSPQVLTAPANVGTNITLTALGGSAPYAWSLTSGPLPTGLTLNAAGSITGIATMAGNYLLTMTVTDSATPSATASLLLSLTVSTQLIVTTSTLPNAPVGMPYAQPLTATGGTAPYSWTLCSGTLPDGITLDPSGVLSGSPNSMGTAALVVTVTDATGAQATASLGLAVPSLRIATTNLPAALLNTVYSATLSVSGGQGPFTFSLSAGTLPSGITLTTAGALTGTPLVAGDFTIVVTVIDATRATAASSLTVSVAAPPSTLHLTALPATVSAATQIPIDLWVDDAAPSDLAGTLTLTFTSVAQDRDDLNTTLLTPNPTRNIPFRVPQGSTHAQFPSPLTLQVGTLAGSISITAAYPNAGTSTPAASSSTTLPPGAPVITAITVTHRDEFALELAIDGYSTTGDMQTALFDLTSAKLTLPSISLNVAALFNTWYLSQEGINQGGTFHYVQKLNFTQSISSLSAVGLTLTNSHGSSQPFSLSLQ